MLSTSVLSFSKKHPLSSSSVDHDDDDDDDESQHLMLGYRCSKSVQNRPHSNQTNRSGNGDYDQHHHHHRHHHVKRVNGRRYDRIINESSSLSSDYLGPKLTSVRVKYLGSIRASSRSTILIKGITSIQPELIDLYTIAQRKFVSSLQHHQPLSSSTTTSSSSSFSSVSNYQIIEICNYGVVIGEPDPTASTTLSVVGESNLAHSSGIVVTKVITPLSNIVLWAGIRFNVRPLKVKGRHRLGAAFIPLSCSSAILKQSSYTPLTVNRSRFLSSLNHPPLFLCVLRKVSSPKVFECHLFACCTVEDAISLSSNLSDVQNGISKVGSPSIPSASELPAHSYTSFDELESRTSSRQLSSSTVSDGHRLHQHQRPHSVQHYRSRSHVRSQSPSLITERASRLTVNLDIDQPINGLTAMLSLPPLNHVNHRREMLNYRREIGLRPWPSSSAGLRHFHCDQLSCTKGNNKSIKSTPSSSSELSNAKRNRNLIRSVDQLSQNSSTSYSVCQACLTNVQKYKVSKDHINNNISSPSQIKSNHVETNNYNGYVVQVKQDESNCNQHQQQQLNDNNTNNHRQNRSITSNNKHEIVPKVPITSEDESHLSKLGRRGQRLHVDQRVNGRGKSDRSLNSSQSIVNQRNQNGPLNGIEDDNLTDLTSDSAFPSSDLIDGDGLLTFIEEDLRSNSFYPPMIKVNQNNHLYPQNHQHHHDNQLFSHSRNSTHRHRHRNVPLELPSQYNVYPYRNDFSSSRISSSSNSLFRRLGRWKLRSWVRKSFNLKFRRKKKRNKVDIFADRDLRYLSLAEPLDYDSKLSLNTNNRLQLTDINQGKGGYFLGMETQPINVDTIRKEIMVTQELPEEQTGLDNLRQLIEKRKKQIGPHIDSLTNGNNLNKPRSKCEQRKDISLMNGQTNGPSGDQSLSKIDLLNELGYLP